MNDAEYEKEKARVTAAFDKWTEPLGLRWWRITYVWERENRPTRETPTGKWETAFSISCDWRYTDAQITVYLPVTAGEDDERLEQFVVHELCHILINELRQAREDWLDHEERTATMLAKAFLWLRDTTLEQTCQH